MPATDVADRVGRARQDRYSDGGYSPLTNRIHGESKYRADSERSVFFRNGKTIVPYTSGMLREHGADSQKICLIQPRAVRDREHACREVACIGDVRLAEKRSEIGVVRQRVDE